MNAEKILKTHEAASALWGWAEPNSALVWMSGTSDYYWVTPAVLNAIGDGGGSGPAYRVGNPDGTAEDLIEAFVADPTPQEFCDRCGHSERGAAIARHRLVVRAGMSIVGLFFCDRCHAALARDIPSLVWG